MATRLALFRGMASHLGELVTITATAAAPQPNQFVSASSGLSVPASAYNGREVWYQSGNGASLVNAQTARRVVASNPTLFNLTVDVPWPALPQAGDVICLVNWHGYSVRIEEIHEKINELIDRVGGDIAAVTTSAAADFDPMNPYLEYPSNWDYIVGAQWQDLNGVWKPIFKRDLEFQPYDHRVRVKGVPRRMLGTASLRLIGEILPGPMDDDTDTTTLPASWIIMQGAAELKRQAAQRSGAADIALTISNMLLPEAEKLKPQTVQDYDVVGGFRWSTRV